MSENDDQPHKLSNLFFNLRIQTFSPFKVEKSFLLLSLWTRSSSWIKKQYRMSFMNCHQESRNVPLFKWFFWDEIFKISSLDEVPRFSVVCVAQNAIPQQRVHWWHLLNRQHQLNVIASRDNKHAAENLGKAIYYFTRALWKRGYLRGLMTAT